MNSELIPAGLITIFSLFCLYLAFFVLTKHRFLNAENFSVFRDMMPFPDIVNYWLIKIFIIISSLIVTLIGINGVLVNI